MNSNSKVKVARGLGEELGSSGSGKSKRLSSTPPESGGPKRKILIKELELTSSEEDSDESDERSSGKRWSRESS